MTKNEKLTFNYNGETFEVSVMRQTSDDITRAVRTRFYGAVESFSDAQDPTAGEFLYDEKTNTQQWNELSGSEQDEMKARLKVYAAYKRKALKEAREGLKVLSEQLFSEDYAKFRFSQKAGCSMCPCSPGFVADRTFYVGQVPKDFWVRKVS